MDAVTKLAVQKVTEEYNPHTVIVYGSRARGDATAESDIDIACFVDEPQISKCAYEFQGAYLDLWVYATRSMREWSNEFLKFDGGFCAIDKTGLGNALIERVARKVLEGPEPLLDEDKLHVKAWSYKMLERAAKDDLEGKYRRVWLQFDLLETYFLLRDRWYFGPKRSLSWLELNDKPAYELFRRTYENPEDWKALETVVEYTTRV